MSENGEQSAPTWFDDSWRPRSLRPARQGWLTPRNRALLMAGVVLLHLVGANLLYRLATRPDVPGPGSLRVDFVFEFPPPPLPPPSPPPPPAPSTRQSAAPARHAAVPKPARQASTPTRPIPPAAARAAAPQTPSIQLQLYDETGRVRLSKQVLDDLDKRYGDSRTFSYQIPRLGDAQKVWGRNRALVYEPTRFDEYWKPDQDILTAFLTEMVEKTTKEIRVPVPGRPDAKMVCKISLLALGGGCGILIAGSDYLGPQDDPATLSDEEQKQCQGWWDKIAAAKTQDAWRSTRKLYEGECRKPRERKPSG